MEVATLCIQCAAKSTKKTWNAEEFEKLLKAQEEPQTTEPIAKEPTKPINLMDDFLKFSPKEEHPTRSEFILMGGKFSYVPDCFRNFNERSKKCKNCDTDERSACEVITKDFERNEIITDKWKIKIGEKEDPETRGDQFG
jgi:hypothetical protein